MNNAWEWFLSRQSGANELWTVELSRFFFFTLRSRIRGYFNFDSRATESYVVLTAVSHLCAAKVRWTRSSIFARWLRIFQPLLVGRPRAYQRRHFFISKKGTRHMAERVKCLRALCRNHQRRKRPFFRRKSTGAQRIKIKNGKIHTHTHNSHTSMKGNYNATVGNIFCRTYSTVRSGYIIQAIRDGNADIVTSISLKKEMPAVLRESKKKERESKTMENVANATGRVRHGSPTLFSFFFVASVSHTRIW